MTATYNPTPVEGYRDGIVVSDTAPDRVYTDRGDLPAGNKANDNSWFTIDGVHYNVHPHRRDLGGYPVRWTSTYGRD